MKVHKSGIAVYHAYVAATVTRRRKMERIDRRVARFELEGNEELRMAHLLKWFGYGFQLFGQPAITAG
jgi:hypothetical protein